MSPERHRSRLVDLLRVVGWVVVVPGLALVVLGATYAADDLADRTEEYDGLGVLAGVLVAGTGLLVVVLAVLIALVARHRPRVAGVVAVLLGLATVWAGLHTETAALLTVLTVAGAALAVLGAAVAVRPADPRGSARVHTLTR